MLWDNGASVLFEEPRGYVGYQPYHPFAPFNPVAGGVDQLIPVLAQQDRHVGGEAYTSRVGDGPFPYGTLR